MPAHLRYMFLRHHEPFMAVCAWAMQNPRIRMKGSAAMATMKFRRPGSLPNRLVVA